MSDYLPVEVVREILIRLPVKPLLKCRCVSKTWHSIISDPTFITAHLSQALTKTTTTNMVLFHYCFDPYSSCDLDHFSVHLDDTNEIFTLNNVPLNCPHKSINYYIIVVGSCNGVLCLADDCFGLNNGYALWNPSINKLVTVPSPNVTFKSHGHFTRSLGFGFDAMNSDYKLVRLVYVQDEDDDFNTPPPLVEIFSLRSGSWHNVSAPGPNYIIDEFSRQVFVNGACHWVGRKRTGTFVNVIVSFDLEKEIFSEINVPKSLARREGLEMAVAVVGGSLALVPYNEWWSVWVMKEYGAAESWIKLFNIDLHGELQRFVAFRKNGEVLVVTRDEKLLSYNPKNQEFLDTGIRGHAVSFYLDTYVESLVLLNDFSDEGGVGRVALGDD